MVQNILIILALVAAVYFGKEWRAAKDENLALTAQYKVLEKKLATDKAKYEKLHADYVREENLARHGIDSQAKALTDLRAQAESAKAKLLTLNAQLEQVRKANHPMMTDDAEKHIADDSALVKQLESQLAFLSDDGKSVVERSSAFRRSQQASNSATRSELDLQIKGMENSIRQMQAQIKTVSANRFDRERANKVEDLRGQIGLAQAKESDLKLQRAALAEKAKETGAAISDEVHREQAEINGDRESVKRKIASVKSDLDNWTKQKKSLQNPPPDPRLKPIEEEIARENDHVRVLDNLIKTTTEAMAAP